MPDIQPDIENSRISGPIILQGLIHAGLYSPILYKTWKKHQKLIFISNRSFNKNFIFSTQRWVWRPAVIQIKTRNWREKSSKTEEKIYQKIQRKKGKNLFHFFYTKLLITNDHLLIGLGSMKGMGLRTIVAHTGLVPCCVQDGYRDQLQQHPYRI